jgi:hypothetical protein
MSFEWKNVTDDALIEEVRKRGFTIRDAQIKVNRKDWNEIQCQCGHKMYVKHTGREWHGLGINQRIRLADRFHIGLDAVETIEAKLKERNT